jgi:hypothetical protein
MDLSTIDLTKSAEAGADLTLEHPVTGEPLDIIITLAGTDSASYRAKQKEIQNKRITKMARGKKADFSITDDEACDILAGCTLGWVGILESGKELEFSVLNAKDLYIKHFWIREQVDAFMGDRANFFSSV